MAALERREVPLPRMAKSNVAGELMPEQEVLGRCQEIARVFRFVESCCSSEGLGTFGHIMTRAVDLLTRRPSVLQRVQQARALHPDRRVPGFQRGADQAGRLLGGEEANVFAVGDPDQAIYHFRGATSEAFDQFLLNFGPERVAARDHVDKSPFHAGHPELCL